MTRIQRFLIVLAAALIALLASSSLATAAPNYHQGLSDESAPLAATPESATYLAPWAAPNQPGCTTDLITTNFSSRGGASPLIGVSHYTVSANRPGWDDVNAIRSWFNQSRAQSSSNYVIDAEGNCKLIVAETMKAWTQTVFNPYSISIEFIATGQESKAWWLSTALPGLRKGARVFADASKRWGIPIRWVNPEGCGVPVKGLTDHDALECNSHTDVKPNFPMTRFINLVKDAAAPPVRVVFKLMDGEGGTLATSRPVEAGGNQEQARYAAFSEFVISRHLGSLRKDGDTRIIRKVVK